MYRPETAIDDQIFAPIREPGVSSLHLALTSFDTHHMTANIPVLDCTFSMGGYIQDATNKIRAIVNTIDSERPIDVHFALIEYRDHPPQEYTFVTRVHGFTNIVLEMKRWLDQCIAQGGGDGPEAVADALHDALNLPWRPEASKICILISDAPPHGVFPVVGDTFPNGCPCGHNPMTIAGKMAAKNIILYTVGVEPSIEPYRSYFQALAQMTRGEYVPLMNAELLARTILGGASELPTPAT